MPKHYGFNSIRTSCCCEQKCTKSQSESPGCSAFPLKRESSPDSPITVPPVKVNPELRADRPHRSSEVATAVVPAVIARIEAHAPSAARVGLVK